MKYIILLVSVLLIFFLGCGKKKTDAEPKVLMKISVLVDGGILVDGNRMEVEDLRLKINGLKGKKGIVYYYREAGNAEPHPNAMRVIKLIVDNKMTISLSSKADFSDYIGQDGKSHLRR